MERVKIVHILTHGQLGGAERSVQWLAGALDRARFDYHFVFLFGGGPVCAAITAMGYPVHLLRWRTGNAWMSRLRLARLLRQIRPALIHDQDATRFVHPWLRLGAFCPLISTQHGSFADRQPEKWLNWLEQLDDWSTDLVVANSNFSAGIHRQLYRRSKLAIRTVYLGIDLTQFVEQPTASPALNNPAKFRVVFVGRFEVIKGALQLPLLAQALRQRGLDQFDILIAGDGRARTACIELAQQLEVEQHLVWLGWQTDVSSVFAGADIVVFPTMCPEAFGLVPLEALAAGTPVVAYEAGGVPEALTDAPGAYLVPQGDVEAMADVIIKLAGGYLKPDPAASRDYVRTRFDVRRTAAELEAIYTELLKK